MNCKLTRLVTLLCLFAAPAVAQNFNVDVGDNLILYPAPSNAYGGAAGQTGFWNAVAHPYTATLKLLDGTLSSVGCTSTMSTSYSNYLCPLTGDDYNLMADCQDINQFSGTAHWHFLGLTDGNYRLFTYAWDPGSSHAGRTSVDVIGSTDAAQVIGGAWSGSPHVLGVTYALHHVTVSGGMLDVDVAGAQSTSGSINGFQFVLDGSTFANFCFGDGSGTSVPCPCGNNGAAQHGCDNSAATGGAKLVASGTTSPDAVVLQANGTLASVPSIFLQGSAILGSPASFGDGARCIGGTLKRLALKFAVSGVVSYPQAGDPSISAQSAALGDPISPGSSRYYQVYYRDSSPSFCLPAPATFNVSSAVSIAW